MAQWTLIQSPPHFDSTCSGNIALGNAPTSYFLRLIPQRGLKTFRIDPGPVSERFAINRTMDINRRSMGNRVLRTLAINRKLKRGPGLLNFS